MPRAALAAILLTCLLPTPPCEGLGQDVTAPTSRESAVVFRDDYGAPHVFGPTDESVVFGAAWVQAEEDWPMVEENFLRAAGRAAEVFGEEALTTDYLTRALEIPRLALLRSGRALREPAVQAGLDDARGGRGARGGEVRAAG